MKLRIVLALLLLAVLPGMAHTVVEEDGQYVISHEWKFQGRPWSCNMSVPVSLYQYFQGRAHQSDDMVQYVLSDYDRNYIQGLANSFDGNMLNVISFVQSLRYVSDQESKGEDDYVRFPLETLVDGEGDCEDLSILAASLLDAMDYGVLLVQLPDHLALAVACDGDVDGTFYEYEGSRYFYLEVTNPGWDLGRIPQEFRRCTATVAPLVHRPRLRMRHVSYHHEAYYSTDVEVPYFISCDLDNRGPGATEDLSVRVVFKRCRGDVVVERVFRLRDLTEGRSGVYELTVSVPRPFYGILEIRAEGTNFSTESMEFVDIGLD